MTKNEAIYLLWAVMAVQGSMREADGFLKMFGNIIYGVARKLSMKLPKQMRVYRGLLLTPEEIDSQDENQIIKEHWPVEFLSFSEDIEVACWFASPDTVLADFVVLQRPTVKGFIAEYDASPRDVLFHHAFMPFLDYDNMKGWVVQNLIGNGIRPVLDQFEHNIQTQSEVILKPLKDLFELTPKEDLCTLTGRELDKKFLPLGVVGLR